MPSIHVAPLAQGLIRQSSTLTSQWAPMNPAKQRHVKLRAKPWLSWHCPPFRHGKLRREPERAFSVRPLTFPLSLCLSLSLSFK